jgi:hypothetical protein
MADDEGAGRPSERGAGRAALTPPRGAPRRVSAAALRSAAPVSGERAESMGANGRPYRRGRSVKPWRTA